MRERHILLGVVAATAVILLIAILIPGSAPPAPTRLPWQIEPFPDGSSRVFGLTLEQTTLAQAEQLFENEPEVSLFAKGEQRRIEAYFDDLTLDGLRSKMILTLAIPAPLLDSIFDRGARISGASSGGNKVSLSSADLTTVYQAPIATITYLPKIDLDPEVIRHRFGEPAQVVAESTSSIQHWLYPQLGLDIALHEDEKDVLQYVAPSRFHQQIEAPLAERR